MPSIGPPIKKKIAQKSTNHYYVFLTNDTHVQRWSVSPQGIVSLGINNGTHTVMEVFTLKLQLQTSGSEINWVYFLMNRFIYKTANFARDLRHI